LGRASWLVLGALTLHVAEELAGFPDWATRHFGTTSPAFFVLSHLPLLAAVLYVVHRTSRPSAGIRWVWLLLVVQSALAANGVFHLVATLWFREYSPGLLTGIVLYTPVSVYLLPLVMPRLGPLRTATACSAGLLISGLLVGSLWLDITFV
jgi:uncharacterized protein with HXXEE motif